MTSSSEARVIRPESGQCAVVTPLRTPELRTGAWTRYGAAAVLGDDVTESMLGDLTERARAAARTQGYTVGWAHGVREAQVAARAAEAEQQARAEQDELRRRHEHATAMAALRDATAALRTATDEVSRRIEAQAVELAWAVTQEIVGHAVRTATPEDVVRRVAEVLPAGAPVVVRLHPEVARSTESAALSDTVSVVPDPRLGRADAVVEVEDHVLDLRVDTALARVREVLA